MYIQLVDTASQFVNSCICLLHLCAALLAAACLSLLHCCVSIKPDALYNTAYSPTNIPRNRNVALIIIFVSDKCYIKKAAVAQ
jgi:hypothetical protein